jgi:uncharacterized protein YvpB
MLQIQHYKHYFVIAMKIFFISVISILIAFAIIIIIKSSDNYPNLPTFNNTFAQNQPVLPDRMVLNVPFTCQAPTHSWDWIHENSCEEASIIMVDYYLQNKLLNEKLAEQEIQNLHQFQLKNYHGHNDLTIEKTAQLAKGYFQVDVKIIDKISIKKIKHEIAQNHPVIVPGLAKNLPNPYYPYPGYHMVVIIGYDGDQFITNDPGIGRGSNYRYDQKTVINFIEDLNSNEKNGLVLSLLPLRGAASSF